MAEEEPDLAAPEGATCAEHRDRMALFKCPRCGRNACLACFHAPVARCVTCMRSDPAEASPPLPFEAGDGTALGRYFRTYGTAFYPWRSAPAFARPGVKPALVFFALSALPLIMLSGVIPHTRSLWFSAGTIILVDSPTPQLIALDVARSIAVQLGLSAIGLASILVPFVSLVAAYAPERKEAALRAVLYRYWLAPVAALISQLADWSVPVDVALKLAAADPSQAAALPVQLTAAAFAQAGLFIFQVLALVATSRLACGLSMAMSLVVVLVPIILQILVVPLAAYGAGQLLPKAKLPPAFQAAQGPNDAAPHH